MANCGLEPGIKSFEEIAREMGCTRQEVLELYDAAIEKIRAEMRRNPVLAGEFWLHMNPDDNHYQNGAARPQQLNLFEDLEEI